jgi:hypothetical protein
LWLPSVLASSIVYYWMAPALRDRLGDRLVAVAVQGEVDRGVPRAHGDLLGRRAGGDPQRYGGVAKVVDA